MNERSKWASSRDLNSPAELADAIRIVADAVRSGELRPLVRTDTPRWEACDIRQLAPTGPWPDYLEMSFEEVATGERFMLTAENFHGTGGRWEALGKLQR
jgi:hypothetical protein